MALNRIQYTKLIVQCVTNVVSFRVQKSRTYRILCKLPKFCCRLSSFSQWLQYIFMGIHSIQWLRNRQLTLIAFLRPYVKLAYCCTPLSTMAQQRLIAFCLDGYFVYGSDFFTAELCYAASDLAVVLQRFQRCDV